MHPALKMDVSEAPLAMQWEYMVSELGDDPVTWKRRLENLGRQGWELVSTHERLEPWNENTGKGTGRSSLKDRPQRPNGKLSVIAILKRQNLTGRR